VTATTRGGTVSGIRIHKKRLAEGTHPNPRGRKHDPAMRFRQRPSRFVGLAIRRFVSNPLLLKQAGCVAAIERKGLKQRRHLHATPCPPLSFYVSIRGTRRWPTPQAAGQDVWFNRPYCIDTTIPWPPRLSIRPVR
jgi:hypothetical protein